VLPSERRPCVTPLAVEFTVYNKKLGIFLTDPSDETECRMVPPLDPMEARELYGAFLTDLFARLSKLKKVSATVFFAGDNPVVVRKWIPEVYPLAPQRGGSPGERFENALRALLDHEGRHACILSSQSPDLPLVYLKRAYVKLKHRDIVLGPTLVGGIYLIGMKRPVPGFFDTLPWGEVSFLGETLRRAESAGLSCALLPPWYEVNALESLSFLETMLLARRIEKRDRLPTVERVLEAIRSRSR
jgi:glycosyltransferase A (GT-A) superfamily protein (DUF2064 family)